MFKDLSLADTESSATEFHEVDILIGSDHYYNIMRDHVIRLKNGLVLVDSKLGYIPSGRANSPECRKHDHCMFVSCFLNSEAAPRVESMLHVGKMERFWKLEDIGIRDDAVAPDDDLALERFEKCVTEVDGRITVGWPWKSSHPDLPENRELAMGRLQHLVRRLQSKESMVDAYDAVIKDQLQRGMIEAVMDESKRSGPVHYLPHHEVVRSDHATTKLRVVYDGSAKRGKNEPSFNDCLLRGPVLLGDLCGLLLRFRTNPVAFTADIEKAYLQVGFQEPDRDVTRFLWLRNIKKPPDRKNVVAYRFCRVLFGIISSAFLLGASIRYKMRAVGTPVSLAVAHDTYVDNLVSGNKTEKEAIAFYSEAMKLFEEMCMNLRAWRTNSKQLSDFIPSEKQAKDTDSKVLGLSWDCSADELGFVNPNVSQSIVITKRNLLQAGSRLFDPCGFLTPITVRVKLLAQHLWHLKLKWDDRIPEEKLVIWHEVSSKVDSAASISIPRFLGIAVSDVELHAFCDASAKVFAAVVYARSAYFPHETKLVISKARLAPLKAPSIPRLELMAVVIGVRLLRFVKSQLKIEPKGCWIWSDSKCVLHWIKSVKVLSVFVENRVREIKESGFPCKYVPTEMNPADLPTKGVSAAELKQSRLWWKGPIILSEDILQWPQNDVPDPVAHAQEIESEERIVLDSPHEAVVPFDLDVSTFKSLERLIGVTARSRRFVANLESARKQEPLKLTKTLSLVERQEALVVWIMFLQRNTLIDDANWRNLRKQLDLFCDETAPLPGFRATVAPPFRTVGVDHIGPIYVSNTDGGKAWVCLFTCAVSRAVHLDAVDSLSADQFLLCFRRFISHYGCPDRVISDNAKCFKLAQKTLSMAERKRFELAWEFIPEFSPWFGGMYERMVGSVKREAQLKKALGYKLVSMQVLETLACEVAALVNSRPLTFSNSVYDQTLTPAHLLGRETAITRLLDVSEPYLSVSSTAKNLVEMYTQRTRILHGFWQIWQRDYLAALRLSHKEISNKRGAVERVPKVGDVVMMKSNKSRVTWPWAIIEHLNRSKDGAVRSVKVRMSDGSMMVRPVNMLVNLELNSCSDGAQPRTGQTSARDSQPKVDGSENRTTDRLHGVSDGSRNRAGAIATAESDESDYSIEY